MALPANYRIHDVFHVSLLKLYHANGRDNPPPPVLIDGEEEYEVEMVLDHRSRGLAFIPKNVRKFQYLIKWVGYGHEHNTWEPHSGLKNSADLLQEYWERQVARQAIGVTRQAVKPKEVGKPRPTVKSRGS